MIDVAALRTALGPLQMGKDQLAELAAALLRPAAYAVRQRCGARADDLPFATSPIAWLDRGRFVTGNERPASFVHFAAGDYYIQDAGSLLAVALLDARGGEHICDLCAAPGGKATAILETVGDDGWLLANEAIQSRLGALRFNLARHGSTRFALTQQDPTRLADTVGDVFDAVLVDAPCSGQSLLTRRRQSASSFQIATIEHNAARQSRILAAAARLVRPGGRLVYSTCTFAYAENEGQIEDFLERHGEWTVEPRSDLQPWESDARPGCYRLWPHRDRCAGAFAARLRRGETVEESSASSSRRRRRTPPQGSDLPDVRSWGTLSGGFTRVSKDRCFTWSAPLWAPLQAVAVEGPELAFRKGSTWFPSFALALRRDGLWIPIARCSLDDAQVAQYLQGNVVPSNQRGWAVACWRGRSLGWVKGDGRRAKNHLPKAARLRIDG